MLNILPFIIQQAWGEWPAFPNHGGANFQGDVDEYSSVYEDDVDEHSSNSSGSDQDGPSFQQAELRDMADSANERLRRGDPSMSDSETAYLLGLLEEIEEELDRRRTEYSSSLPPR